jgi:hypothetical protein
VVGADKIWREKEMSMVKIARFWQKSGIAVTRRRLRKSINSRSIRRRDTKPGRMKNVKGETMVKRKTMIKPSVALKIIVANLERNGIVVEHS